jgi:hypothetical protein
LNKSEKSLLLYDYEPPINDKDKYNIIDDTTDDDVNTVINYRIDDIIKKETFLNYWHDKSMRSNSSSSHSSLINHESTVINLDYLQNLGELNSQYGQHHLSINDLELLEKRSLTAQTPLTSLYDKKSPPSLSNSNNTENKTESGAVKDVFKFAGFFFRRDKERNKDKHQHLSLKRAKSGMHLDRKKLSLNLTTKDDKHSKTKSIYSDTNNTNNINNNNNNNKVISTPSSPIRPCRSHESLMTITSTLNSPVVRKSFYQSNKSKNSFENQESSPLSTTTPNDYNNKFLIDQTPRIKSSKSSYIFNNSKARENSFQSIENSSDNNLNTSSQKLNYSTVSKHKSDHLLKLNLKDEITKSGCVNNVSFQPIHDSILNEPNCFEITCNLSRVSVDYMLTIKNENEDVNNGDSLNDNKFKNANETYETRRLNYKNTKSRSLPPSTSKVDVDYQMFNEPQMRCCYFMCRSLDERNKWLHCLKDVCLPNLQNERHFENSLQLWLLEAKGQALNNTSSSSSSSSSSSFVRKYYCEIKCNEKLFAKSCSKEKSDILFWGETFDFNFNFQHQKIESIRIEMYQENVSTAALSDVVPPLSSSSSSSSSSKKKSKKDNNNNNNSAICIGFINVPILSFENNQPVEKWYCLEPISKLNNSVDATSTPTPTSINSSIASSISASLTTSFSKDATCLRVKAKYQSVDILPMNSYHSFVEYIRYNYLNLMVKLEPHLTVRVKDDLANALVRIAHKLGIQTNFLSDLVLVEVLQSDDTSLTFRGNSLATKSMESYLKLVGDTYLKQTLSDCVRSIIDTNHDLEIDPSKCTNALNLQANREELVQILHLVCGRVFNSVIYFPIEMKRVFARLRENCKKAGKTDEMCDYLISASIFLRFICPAILSPNLFGLTHEYPEEKAARKLTLAAKTLQTIANFSKFGAKEFYMSFDKMNKFVDEHTIMMHEFLNNISTLTEEEANNEMINFNSILPMTPTSPINNNIETCLNVESIDLGKQLSILHVILTSVIKDLHTDKNNKSNIDENLLLILDNISKLKNNNSQVYSYENRLHYAIINTNNDNTGLITPDTPINNKYDNREYCNINKMNAVKSSSSPLPSSSSAPLSQHQQIEGNSSLLSSSSKSIKNQTIKFEEEIDKLKNKLRDTEISLRKEQSEKQLIEMKLKQQQIDNEEQMKQIINR